MRNVTLAALLAPFALVCSPALARGLDGATGVTARAGVVDVDHYGVTWAVGAGVDVGIADHVSVAVGLDYFKDDDRQSPVEKSLRDTSVSAILRYIAGSHGVHPYVGAGPVLHMTETQERFTGSDTWQTKTHDSSLGFDFGGGVLIPSSATISWIADLRYRVTSSITDSDHLALSMGVMKWL